MYCQMLSPKQISTPHASDLRGYDLSFADDRQRLHCRTIDKRYSAARPGDATIHHCFHLNIRRLVSAPTLKVTDVQPSRHMMARVLESTWASPKFHRPAIKHRKHWHHLHAELPHQESRERLPSESCSYRRPIPCPAATRYAYRPKRETKKLQLGCIRCWEVWPQGRIERKGGFDLAVRKGPTDADTC